MKGIPLSILYRGCDNGLITLSLHLNLMIWSRQANDPGTIRNVVTFQSQLFPVPVVSAFVRQTEEPSPSPVTFFFFRCWSSTTWALSSSTRTNGSDPVPCFRLDTISFPQPEVFFLHSREFTNALCCFAIAKWKGFIVHRHARVTNPTLEQHQQDKQVKSNYSNKELMTHVK